MSIHIFSLHVFISSLTVQDLGEIVRHLDVGFDYGQNIRLMGGSGRKIVIAECSPSGSGR